MSQHSPTVPNTSKTKRRAEPPKINGTLPVDPRGPCHASHDPHFAPPTEPTDIGRFGPYRILKRLGKGGMGTVYLALDTRLDRQVALKLCQRAGNPLSLERFRCEARAAAALRHANLCPVHECDVIEDVPYFTMALIEGPNLGCWIEERGGLSPREAAVLVRKLALAMQYAHAHGVIHRDLKPSNVALERGEPVILDFGLARQGDSRLTLEGSVMGTPAYMAPEQVEGDVAAIGPTCDIYSLGAVLYELLSGRPPFDGPPMATLAKILNEIPAPVRELAPEVDPRLEAICLKCLAKDRADRWPDMAALAAALTEWLKHSSSRTVAVAPSQRLARPIAETVEPRPAAESATEADETETPRPRPRRSLRRRKPQIASWKAPLIAGLSLVLLVVVVILLLQLRRYFNNSSPAAEDKTPPRQPASGVGPAAPPEKSAAQKPVVEEPARPPATPTLHIVQAPERISLVAGRKHSFPVRLDRRGCKGDIRVQLENLPPGVTASELVLAEGQAEGRIELAAAVDRAEADDVVRSATLRAAYEELQDSKTIQITLEKRETLTPAGTVRGYLHDYNSDGPFLILVVPGGPPTPLRLAAGVEVRTAQPPALIVDDKGNSRAPSAEEIKALRIDGKPPTYRGTFADLHFDRYLVIELGKSADGSVAVRTITVQTPPPGFPPPPPPPPGRAAQPR
jgi:serine/threonine protein kinase